MSAQDDSVDAGAAPPAAAPGDIVMVPLAAAAVALRRLLDLLLTILVRLLDFAFPILLQAFRFPLFTLRIAGDAATALMTAAVRRLPLAPARREQCVARLRAQWRWLRAHISYRAFEEALHRAFETGMAWVFRTCRTLSPGQALLVIAAAVLWLPVSFGVATALHAFLIAKAMVLPPWMQVLHAAAALIAKSKLLVLPAYPAAWPQARKHPAVQALARLWRRIAAHPWARRLRHRYRQIDGAERYARRVVGETPALRGIGAAARGIAGALLDALAAALRALGAGALALGLRLPVAAPLIRRYAMHYRRAERADRGAKGSASARVKAFFGRWAIKLSPAYYEDREKA